jgi:hypothetical protein
VEARMPLLQSMAGAGPEVRPAWPAARCRSRSSSSLDRSILARPTGAKYQGRYQVAIRRSSRCLVSSI